MSAVVYKHVIKMLMIELALGLSLIVISTTDILLYYVKYISPFIMYYKSSFVFVCT